MSREFYDFYCCSRNSVLTFSFGKQWIPSVPVCGIRHIYFTLFYVSHCLFETVTFDLIDDGFSCMAITIQFTTVHLSRPNPMLYMVFFSFISVENKTPITSNFLNVIPGMVRLLLLILRYYSTLNRPDYLFLEYKWTTREGPTRTCRGLCLFR